MNTLRMCDIAIAVISGITAIIYVNAGNDAAAMWACITMLASIRLAVIVGKKND